VLRNASSIYSVRSSKRVWFIHLRAWAFGVIFLFSLSQAGELLMWLYRNKASVCAALGKNHCGQAAILWQIQTRVHRATSGCEHY